MFRRFFLASALTAVVAVLSISSFAFAHQTGPLWGDDTGDNDAKYVHLGVNYSQQNYQYVSTDRHVWMGNWGATTVGKYRLAEYHEYSGGTEVTPVCPYDGWIEKPNGNSVDNPGVTIGWTYNAGLYSSYVKAVIENYEPPSCYTDPFGIQQCTSGSLWRQYPRVNLGG